MPQRSSEEHGNQPGNSEGNDDSVEECGARIGNGHSVGCNEGRHYQCGSAASEGLEGRLSKKRDVDNNDAARQPDGVSPVRRIAAAISSLLSGGWSFQSGRFAR
ncbi:hypothetical protein ACFL5O_10125 [Myxococcota bacterium]